MTESEADVYLRYILNGYLNRKNHLHAVMMARNALKKQIPMKPFVEGDGYADGHLVYDTWICPNCEKHYEIDYDIYDYCPNCGQHIDTSQLNWQNLDINLC